MQRRRVMGKRDVRGPLGDSLMAPAEAPALVVGRPLIECLDVTMTSHCLMLPALRTERSRSRQVGSDVPEVENQV